MKIKIKDFEEGQEIPIKFTCDSEDHSPEIFWEDIPTRTESLVLIVDDPDAPVGNFVHWVVYNIPPNVTHLEENFTRAKRLSNGITQGKNDFGKIGYNGPCPPKGHGYHRYYFTLYATTIKNIERDSLTKKEIIGLIENKILAKDIRMGRYRR
jgi:Raf kinase inhibitor-like YbhB/YbcL family protein